MLGDSPETIELDRNPVKDAAGLNDFLHAKKVESRAAKAGFFTVGNAEGFCNYNIGRQANGLLQKVNDSLQAKSQDLDTKRYRKKSAGEAFVSQVEFA